MRQTGAKQGKLTQFRRTKKYDFYTFRLPRGLVISGILIMVLPALVNADAIWFAMPVTELLVMLYAASMIRKYTRALPGGTTYADTCH